MTAARAADTLAVLLPREQDRACTLLDQYEAMRSTCAMAAAEIELVLDDTDRAVREDNVIAMLACYERLRGLT